MRGLPGFPFAAILTPKGGVTVDAEKTGKLIAELRREQDMTQEELARKLGVTRKAVSRWETGRGYPDIEILPKLAQELNITINELLSGQRIQQETVDDTNLTYVCQQAAQTQRRLRKRTLVLIIFAVLWGVAQIVVYGYWFYRSVMGSDICVIAEDYSSITYYGATYVPLDVGKYQCRPGEQLVSEASVEGASFWGKLLYGDTVYAISGVPDGSLIWLCTDYDDAPSEYYVLESRLAEYEAMLADFTADTAWAVIWQSDGNSRELPLEMGFAEALLGLTEYRSQDAPQEYDLIDLLLYEENHIFFHNPGSILMNFDDGGYYWCQNLWEQNYVLLDAAHLYPIGGEYTALLDTLFELQFR